MISNLTDMIENYITSMGVLAPVLACLLITIESILPFLPLFVFITINFVAFGTLFGFIISWIFTCLGCFLSYYLFKKGFKRISSFNDKDKGLFNKTMYYVKKLSLPSLTAIVAIPFTPAFMINIAAGIAKINFKKFATAIIIGKLFMVYFWGFIGLSLVESFKNPIVLIRVIVMVGIAYIISKIINDNFTK